MAPAVKVKDVVEAFDMTADELLQYLDKRTGEVVMVTNEELAAADDEEDLTDFPEWQRESIVKAREILETEYFVALPDKHDIHEYKIMEEFCWSHPNRRIGDRLAREIKGSGAFGRFKREIATLGVEDEWYSFRESRFERIAIEWLKDQGIEYTRDDTVQVDGASN